MPRVNKHQIPGLIQAREEFYGSSLWSEHVGGTYRLYYLDTLMATVDLDGEVWVIEPAMLSAIGNKYRALVVEALNKPRKYPK